MLSAPRPAVAIALTAPERCSRCGAAASTATNRRLPEASFAVASAADLTPWPASPPLPVSLRGSCSASYLSASPLAVQAPSGCLSLPPAWWPPCAFLQPVGQGTHTPPRRRRCSPRPFRAPPSGCRRCTTFAVLYPRTGQRSDARGGQPAPSHRSLTAATRSGDPASGGCRLCCAAARASFVGLMQRNIRINLSAPRLSSAVS